MPLIDDKTIWTKEEQKIIDQHKKYLYRRSHTKRLSYMQLTKAIKLRIKIIQCEIKYHEIMRTYWKTKVIGVKQATRQKNIEFTEAEIIRLKLILKSLSDLLWEIKDNLQTKILPSNIDTPIKDALVEVICNGVTIDYVCKRKGWTTKYSEKAKAILYKYTGGLIK